MTARDARRGASLLLVLMVVILLAGIAALTLSAAISRTRLVAAARDAVEGRAVASHALAVARVGEDTTLRTLADGDSLWLPVASPLALWQVRVEARRLGTMVRLLAVATRTGADGGSAAAQRATLLLRWNGADTLRVISR